MLLLAVVGAVRIGPFRSGWLCGLSFHLCAQYWMLLMPTITGALTAWISLSAYCALFPAIWVYFCWRILPEAPANPTVSGFEFWNRIQTLSWPRRQLWALYGAVGWTALEMLRSWLLTGFPWNLLGVTQVEMLPIVQLASWTGVYGVSFLVAWVSLALALAVAAIAARPGLPWVWSREILPAGLVMTLIWIAGYQRVQHPPETPNRLRIALIQPDVDQMAIWLGLDKERRFERLLELSLTALNTEPRPDLLVWPESGIPTNLDRPQRINYFVRDTATPLIFNYVDQTSTTNDNRGRLYNSAFLMNREGEIVHRAYKRQLVIFGEYVPLARFFPFLQNLLSPYSVSFDAGDVPGILRLDRPKFTAGSLICFEDAFPSLARDAARLHPDFLVNLTNAAWFGDSRAQWQQLRGAVFRAVETRLPLVRCTNNGITCWIDPYGRIKLGQKPNDYYGELFRIVEVPLGGSKAPTFYLRYGDWFGWSCVALFAGWWVMRWRTSWSRPASRRSNDRRAPHSPLNL